MGLFLLLTVGIVCTGVGFSIGYAVGVISVAKL